MLNRAIFFDNIRTNLFSGTIAQAKVDGIDRILNAWESRYDTGDLRHLANVLGQVFHETGTRMYPVREGFATTDGEARRAVANLAKKRGPESAVAKYAREVNGHVYYGRGLIQLTWNYNYEKVGTAMGLDLLGQPDLAMDPMVSVDIVFQGMLNGWFSGKKLEDYFNTSADNPLGARKIVNGTDQAGLIAGYHETFLTALKAAQFAAQTGAVPAQPPQAVAAPMGTTGVPRYPEDRKPAYKSKTNLANIATGVSGTAVTVGSAARSVDPKGNFSTFLTTHPEIFVLLGCVIILGAGFLLWKWMDDRAKQLNR